MAKKKATRKKASSRQKPQEKATGNRKDPYEGWRDHRGYFQKGQPPGPGRPEGSFSLITILRRELSRGQDKNAKAIMKKLVEKALDGDGESIKQCIEHIDGKALQRVVQDLTHKHEATIVVRDKGGKK